MHWFHPHWQTPHSSALPKVTSVPLAWLCFIIHDSLLWCSFFHLQEQRNHPRDYQLERCLTLSLLQNAFFPSLKTRSLWSEGCKETANSWQGCNCGKHCKNNPFLPLEKGTKWTLHLEILIFAMARTTGYSPVCCGSPWAGCVTCSTGALIFLKENSDSELDPWCLFSV